MTIFLYCYLLIHLICGFICYGLTFAYFQRVYPELANQCKKKDRLVAILVMLNGPFGFYVILSSFGKKGFSHGIKFW